MGEDDEGRIGGRELEKLDSVRRDDESRRDWIIDAVLLKLEVTDFMGTMQSDIERRNRILLALHEYDQEE